MTIDQLLHTFLTEMFGRIDGPMRFRLILQPVVALCFALRDGRRDALAGRTPYGLALFSDAAHRRHLLAEGWKGYGNVFVAAIVIDLVYQYMAIGALRVLQGLITACLLALLPYTLFRGPFNRLCSLWSGRKRELQHDAREQRR